MSTPRSSFISYLRPGARCVFTAPWCKTPTIRKVLEVKSAKASFSHPTKLLAYGGSWLDFPKATEIVETVPGRFIISHEDTAGANVLCYDFRLEALAAPGVVEPENAK